MSDVAARQVCIRVPAKGALGRNEYERLTSRSEWVHRCLGDDGVYVGRPKCDGGWYEAPAVKAGSLFANPYPLKDFSLDESLTRFRAFLLARIRPNVTPPEIIQLLPAKVQKLASQRFKGGHERDAVGRSVAHLRLGVVGEDFRAELLALRGKRLGCFCDEADTCHATVLADVIEELLRAETHAPSSKRQKCEDLAR